MGRDCVPIALAEADQRNSAKRQHYQCEQPQTVHNASPKSLSLP